MKKILIIDSCNILHGFKYHYYKTKKDLMMYFFETLIEVQQRVQADGIILGADIGKSRYRKELLPNYKITSSRGKAKKDKTKQEYEQDEAVYTAVDGLIHFKEIFPNIAINNVEFDDVAGILNSDSDLKDFEFICVTQDKDLFTVFTHKKVFDWSKMRYKTLEDSDGLNSNQFLFAQSLMGDLTDGIKGIPDVGKATAKKIALMNKTPKELRALPIEEIEAQDCWRVRKALKSLKDDDVYNDWKLSFQLVRIMNTTKHLNEEELKKYNQIKDELLSFDFEQEFIAEEHLTDNLDMWLLENSDIEVIDLVEDLKSLF